MIAVPLSEKIRRSVGQATTKQAVSEIAAALQAGDDDLMLCFVGQNHRPDQLQVLFQENFYQKFASIAIDTEFCVS